jgi:hypothetical protein
LQYVTPTAIFLNLLRLLGNGRFLDRRVCGLGRLALAFQAQFDEVLPKLAVVHDFSLQLTEPLREFTGPVTGRTIKTQTLLNTRRGRKRSLV